MSTVLVVDDEPEVTELIRTTLERPGVRVLEAQDGAEALEMAEESHPELVFLDIEMPRMDGIEACRRLRDAHGSSRMQIVIITGVTDEAAHERALEAGADNFLIKPFSPLELMGIVDALDPKLVRRWKQT